MKPVLKPTPNREKTRRYDDLLGFVGGLGCLGLSRIDAGWSAFWLVAGSLLIVWSAVSFLRRKSGG